MAANWNSLSGGSSSLGNPADLGPYRGMLQNRGATYDDRANTAYNWGVGKAGELDATGKAVTGQALDTSRMFNDWSKSDRGFWEGTYKPAMQEQMDFARNYTTDARKQANRGGAMADVGMTFDSAADMSKRALQGYGVKRMAQQKIDQSSSSGIGSLIGAGLGIVGGAFGGPLGSMAGSALGRFAGSAANGAMGGGSGMTFAEGGVVPGEDGEDPVEMAPDDDLTSEVGGENMVPPEASPSGGAAVDDVTAQVSAGEFVVPKDVTAWYGEKYMQGLIDKARKEMTSRTAAPQPGPPQAMAISPTFQSEGATA
jgi:hypothetical protein